MKSYVNTEGRVDYQNWIKTGKQELEAYLQSLAEPWPVDLNPPGEKSALINSYNAFTVYWVLVNYPVQSIWQTDHPFSAVRHLINGRKMSLDQIETRLRALGDPRTHAALVCAARSCPPLRREAYVADRLSDQLDDNARTWLRNTGLNTFFPDRRLAQVSTIFKWYAEDFRSGGGSVEKFLAQYAPDSKSRFMRQTSFKIEYKTYNWGLNDTSTLGSDYSRMRFLWDWFRNRN
ncbi:MAG TPA: DUF547 domain-containing protein [Bryobacteraceae bacterium]|nr:DUF547 domain-containing protein [Bryobacteraceae bacterium]